MIRTAYSHTNLTPIPENCTFTLTIEMRDENTRPGNVLPNPTDPFLVCCAALLSVYYSLSAFYVANSFVHVYLRFCVSIRYLW